MKNAFQLSAIALASSLLLITGCDRSETPSERAAERAEDRAEAAAERAEDRADAAEDRADAAGPGLGERTEAAAGRAGQAIDDAKITTTIKGKYIGDDVLEGSDISVDTEQGVVTLTGTVRTEAAKQRANEVATGVEGVASVNNQLTVSSR